MILFVYLLVFNNLQDTCFTQDVILEKSFGTDDYDSVSPKSAFSIENLCFEVFPVCGLGKMDTT